MDFMETSTAPSILDNITDINQPVVQNINGVSIKFLNDMLLANKVTMIVIGIISTLLNLFNLVVYLKHKELWTTPNVMLINLSLSDLMLGVSLIILVNVRSFKNIIVVKYAFAIAGFIQNTSIYMSSVCIVCITMERWIAITLPLFYKVHFTITKAYVLVGVTWIYGCITGGIIPIYYLLKLPIEAFRRPINLGNILPRGMNIYIMQAHSLSCIVISGLLYLNILATMKRRATSSQNRLAADQSKKSTAIAGTVVGTVIACYTPSALLNAIAPPWATTTWWGIVITYLVMNIVFCNSFMNVFIYASRNEAFRKTYKNIFQRRTSVHTGQSSSNVA